MGIIKGWTHTFTTGDWETVTLPDGLAIKRLTAYAEDKTTDFFIRFDGDDTVGSKIPGVTPYDSGHQDDILSANVFDLKGTSGKIINGDVQY